MSHLTVVTLLIVVIATGQADLPKKPLYDLLEFDGDEYEEAFKSLDLNNDNKINIEDLKSLYYHKDSEFAKKKFTEMLDTSKSPGSIDLEEFTSFMEENQVKRLVHGITYSPTLEARQRFYADEILSYVYLVLDKHAIEKLFDSIESTADGKLYLNEIKKMQAKLMNGDTQYELSDWEAKLVLAEIGAGSDTISKEDFEFYLKDGKLSLFFRECRKSLTATGSEYDNACLIRNLVTYTTSHLTEYMMTLVFDELEGADKDERVSFSDVQDVYGSNEQNAKDFITYINGKKEKTMTYGELRNILGVQAIKIFLEKECMAKGEESFDLKGRIFCLKWKLWSFISKKFAPKFVAVPTLDLIHLFEDLDTTDDGIIEQEEDLENGKNWVHGVAKKFMDDVGPPKGKAKVNLHDFFYYLYQPYMTCAIAECQIIKGNIEKLACYNNEMKDTITNILPKKELDDFFGFYEAEIIYDATLEEFDMPEPVIENFLTEVGQGDHYIIPIGFMYFVKQQELGHLFVADEHATPRKHLSSSMLHDKLLYYLEHHMTEYDISTLFRKLDINHDMVLDKRDVKEAHINFITRIALYGNSKNATFQEFWMFLNSKAPGSHEPRKRQLEKDCGQINQELQLTCFKDKIMHLH